MSMVEPGSDPGLSAGPSDDGGGGSIANMPAKKKLLIGVAGIGGLLVIYLYAKSKKSTAATAASGSSTGSLSDSTTPTLVLPSSNQDSVNGADYASLTQGLGNLSNQVSQIQSNPTQPTTTPVSQPTQPTQPSVGPPPNVPSSILAGIPGQTIVQEAYDPATSGWLALSNKGGVFSLNAQGQPGPGFYGSPLGDPGTDGWIGPNGTWARTAQQISVRPSGGYTITDTAGENYNYGPA